MNKPIHAIYRERVTDNDWEFVMAFNAEECDAIYPTPTTEKFLMKMAKQMSEQHGQNFQVIRFDEPDMPSVWSGDLPDNKYENKTEKD